MFFNSVSNDGQKVLDREGDLGEVWISGYNFAHDVPKLKKHQIKAICSGVELGFKFPEDFKHLTFDLEDSHEQDARMTFKPAFEFIESARKQTNVLVHCAAGISRSSTLLVAYMLQKYKIPYQTCLRKVQSCRSCCQPNMGFVKQLKQLEKSLGILPEK